jgi:hypothetical protein
MAYETSLWQGHVQVASYRGSVEASTAAVTGAPFSAAVVMISNTHTTQVLYVNFAGGTATTEDTDRLEVPAATTVVLPIKVQVGSNITVGGNGAGTTYSLSLIGGE